MDTITATCADGPDVRVVCGFEQSYSNNCLKTAINIFEYRLVIFPINISDAHWIACVVFVEERRIWLWDSYGSKHIRVCANILRYLNDEHQTKHSLPLPLEWCMSYDSRVLQHGHVHCGAFICTTIYLLLRNMPLNFTEEQMSVVRKRIALAILDTGTGNGNTIMQGLATPTPQVHPRLVLDAVSSTRTIQHSEAPTVLPMSRNGNDRAHGCFYFPFCRKPRDECGGTRRGLCKITNEGEMLTVNQITFEQFLVLKQEAKKQQRGKRAMVDYHVKKKAAKQTKL